MKRHVTGSQSELIWKGRVQIGDEPGVYGDASYSGLAIDLPVTLTPLDAGGTPVVSFELTAEDASSFGAPYPGHLVTVREYSQVSGTNPPVWQATDVATGRLTGNALTVSAPLQNSVRFVSVRVEADVTVSPGFYDDFVLTSLSLKSTTHYADFGFRA